jgi:hypothetical protein
MEILKNSADVEALLSEDFELALETRDKYPTEEIVEMCVEFAKKRLLTYDRHIEKVRSHYNQITNFKERKEYFEGKLKQREEGYLLAKKDIENFLIRKTIRPHEFWVNESTYKQIKRMGIKPFIERELTFIIR